MSFVYVKRAHARSLGQPARSAASLALVRLARVPQLPHRRVVLNKIGVRRVRVYCHLAPLTYTTPVHSYELEVSETDWRTELSAMLPPDMQGLLLSVYSGSWHEGEMWVSCSPDRLSGLGTTPAPSTLHLIAALLARKETRAFAEMGAFALPHPRFYAQRLSRQLSAGSGKMQLRVLDALTIKTIDAENQTCTLYSGSVLPLHNLSYTTQGKARFYVAAGAVCMQ